MISHEMLAKFSAVFWPALVRHLWQATLVTGVCLLALPAFRSAGAKARQLLWTLAFLRFTIPQALVFFLAKYSDFRQIFGNEAGMQLQQVSSVLMQVTQPSIIFYPQPAASDSATIGHTELYCILTILWIAGSVFLLSRWWFRQHTFAGSLRIAGYEAGKDFMPMLESLRARLGLRYRMNLRVAWQGVEPGVCGVWRPVLVLPKDMLQQLSAAEVEAVLGHELVHAARWDNLWNYLQMLVCCVFWFYPVVWFLDRRLIAERERSCDERVVRALRNSRAYASGLIKMTSLGIGLRVAGVSPMAGANLKRRIENIMSNKTNTKALLPARILLSSIIGLTVLLYVISAPFPSGIAQTASSKLTIENSENSPLKIASAAVEGISLSPKPTAQVAAQLINPKVVVKNSSSRAAAVYVLEFRKAGSSRLYLTRQLAALEPNGTDSIEKSEYLWSAGEKATDAGNTWAVRIVSIAFKDGSHLTLHPAPIPPPPGVWETSQQVTPLHKDLIEPIHIGGALPESKLRRRVEPIYPEAALKARVQGRETLEITVDEEGNVVEAKVLQGHPYLDEAAVAAVKQWKYNPTFLNGKPIPVKATVSIVFNLK
jgi:TonB family protein